MNLAKIATVAAASSILLSPLAAFANHSEGGAAVGAHLELEARQEHRAEVKVETRAKMEDHGKDRANQEIERRIDGMNKMIARINDAKRVEGMDKASIVATLNAQIAALTELKAKIESNSSTTTLKADIQSITKSYRIFALVMPQGAISAAASRIKSVAGQMETLSAKLKTRLEAVGGDQSANLSLLADANAKIADSKVQAEAALNLIAGLKPDNGDATVQASNTAALKSARDKVQAGQNDLKTAREDFRKIMVNVKGKGEIKGSVHATTTP